MNVLKIQDINGNFNFLYEMTENSQIALTIRKGGDLQCL